LSNPPSFYIVELRRGKTESGLRAFLQQKAQSIWIGLFTSSLPAKARVLLDQAGITNMEDILINVT